MSFLALYLISFVLALEMVTVEKRVYCGILMAIFFAFGEMVVSGTIRVVSGTPMSR
jgi:hypothetical protein